MIASAQAPFTDQVDTASIAVNLYYVLGVTCAVLLLVGLVLVDVGAVKRGSMLHSVVQKMIGFFIGLLAYSVIGHAIWNLQFYVAFEIANPIASSFGDWWFGGGLLNGMAHELDPAVGMNADADNQQIFFALLAVFAGLLNVLLHFSVTERIKSAAYYIICSVVGGITFPILALLTFGPVTQLTTHGLHDFFGSLIIYVPIGMLSLILAWRIGPRIGGLMPDRRLPGDGLAQPNNLGITVVGVLFVLVSLLPIVLGSGYLIPDVGYLGPNMTETSIGLLMGNFFMAVTGGTLVGAIIAYRTRNSFYMLLGSLGGYLAAVPGFDVYKPWQMFLISLPAPVVVYAVMTAIQNRGIEDSKLVPLGLGAGTYGIVILGVVGWGTPSGGYLGIEEGRYAHLGGEINVGWQLLGLLTSMAIAALTMAVLLPIIERTVGLRVSEQEELAADAVFWNTRHHDSLDAVVPEEQRADVPAPDTTPERATHGQP